MSIIQIQHLYKTFGTGENAVHALEDISLDIQKGEIFGIIGLSGAGKSTLVRCMNLLERPTSGTVIVDGKDMTALSEKELRLARRNVTMIFQSFNLLMQRTVLKNVCFPMELSGTPAAQARKRALELLDLVGLREKADAYPSQLSGGQKQRVAIAGVIAMEPECIVLDEATAMLDPAGRREVLDTVHRLNRQRGITVVHITHHMSEAEDADRVIVMNDGVVAMDGTPRDIFSRVEELRSLGLAAPDTVELLHRLNGHGMSLPLTAITVDECARAIFQALHGAEGK
mgnify:CR=1 FL=1